jgi:hypothetical protein
LLIQHAININWLNINTCVADSSINGLIETLFCGINIACIDGEPFAIILKTQYEKC